MNAVPVFIAHRYLFINSHVQAALALLSNGLVLAEPLGGTPTVAHGSWSIVPSAVGGTDEVHISWGWLTDRGPRYHMRLHAVGSLSFHLLGRIYFGGLGLLQGDESETDHWCLLLPVPLLRG
jgi:hypothetical protein